MKCEIRLSLSFGTRCSFDVKGCAGEFERPPRFGLGVPDLPGSFLLGFCEFKADIDSSHTYPIKRHRSAGNCEISAQAHYAHVCNPSGAWSPMTDGSNPEALRPEDTKSKAGSEQELDVWHVPTTMDPPLSLRHLPSHAETTKMPTPNTFNNLNVRVF
jgi:hypothetical protein